MERLPAPITSVIDRRQLLRMAGGAAAVTGSATLLGGCSFFSTEPDNGGPDGVDGRATLQDKEAPRLAAQVKAGKLAPLEDRIPEKPCVITPYDQRGAYGGTMRSLWPDPTARVTPTASARWVERDPVTLDPMPSMVQKWKLSADQRTYTFTLRKGLKWSDGKPYTTDDVLYVMQNVFLNSTLTPAYPTAWQVDGKPPKVKKIDAVTFSLRYDRPPGLLLALMAFQGDTLLQPKHYLKQFHPDFADKAELTRQAKKAGFPSWDEYYTAMNDPWTNAELPVMHPWVVTEPMTASGGRAVLTRNPYFYKTDPDGRQLPYIDKVTYELVSEDTRTLRVANGDFDLQRNNLVLSVSDLGLLADHTAKGHYNIYHWKPDANFLSLYLNQYDKSDAVMRKLLQNRDFRQALSIGINRQEVNDALFNGLASTDQPTALPEDQYYVKGLGSRFTEYDPKKAGAILDSLKLIKGPDGIRRRPDGKPLEIIIETMEYQDAITKASAAYQYVVRHWRALGIRASLKLYDKTAWVARMQSGGFAVGAYAMVEYLWDVDPNWWIPTNGSSYWAPLYGLWHASGGKQGVEPPASIKEIQSLYEQMKLEPDPDKRTPLGQRIMKAHDENVWTIGIASFPWLPTIANADLINVRKDAVASYRLGHEQATRLEQLAYTNPEAHTQP